MKIKKSYYKESTPVWLKILGDFLNYAGAASAIISVVENDKYLAVLFILMGALGKAITNAFTSEEPTQ
jgi:hypothetical protein